MATRVEISRTTLSAIKAGDPGPAIGIHLRVMLRLMSVLGVSGELELLACDTLHPAPPGSAGARSSRARPSVQVLVSAEESRHEVQNLQSLALHEDAVRLVRSDPGLLFQAEETLQRWIMSGNSRSSGLWQERQNILGHCKWRKVLGRTRRAQELRQASPLTTVLPDSVRQSILAQVSELKEGVMLVGAGHKTPS